MGVQAPQTCSARKARGYGAPPQDCFRGLGFCFDLFLLCFALLFHIYLFVCLLSVCLCVHAYHGAHMEKTTRRYQGYHVGSED